MTLVLFAVPQESRCFVRRLRGGRANPSGTLGELHGAEVAIVHTGMGHTAASRAAGRAIEEFRPSLVIASGFAGGLSPELGNADLVSGANISSPAAVALLPPEIQPVQLLSARTALDTPAAKRLAREQSSADAVDMESAAIHAVCGALNLPLLSLRIISDAADAALPLPSAVAFDLDRQRVRTFAIIRYLATHPAEIPPLLRFIRRLPHLQEKLAAALAQVIENHAPQDRYPRAVGRLNHHHSSARTASARQESGHQSERSAFTGADAAFTLS